ncbi:aminotransferase class V-fold PLP-dependent enzyme [Alkaliphilus oremlandii]|uniref:Cysteine desulfurase n=1 Tax=Alkaliphilus oremlandii (strain OhILAs) TaxID=350688 RepID=A8MLQ0_ALKOO|nr:aminotransferase class V-fold PLP-dependent enzyme [Alkaliphilus oremlandii]ABW17967.1 Cysteine desulfurase [Alkaliphilus oremlandii OhILAs]
MEHINFLSPYKDFVVGVDTKVPLADQTFTTAINFDNAATTPPFDCVMNDLVEFSPWYSSIHRGAGYKSQYSTKLYEESRKIISSFIGADMDYHSIIFLKNTTEAINKLSNKLLALHKDGVVLSTCMEHHSNDLPWRNKYTVDYIAVDKYGELSMEDLKNKLISYGKKVQLVTITGASNVTGYINPIHEIAELVHQHGAKLLVDGAQLVPHGPVNMKPVEHPQHIDYLVFSAHKMYAPFGTGVLIGPKDTFRESPPDYTGGGTVQFVSHDHIKWLDPPEREEAGTPNIMGVLALSSAIKKLLSIGMAQVESYERALTRHAYESLSNIPNVELYTNKSHLHRTISIIPFNIKGLHHSIVAAALSKEFGIAVRNGCFCAQPYLQRLLNVSAEDSEEYMKDPTLPMPGMVRLSFGIYNSIEEINILTKALFHISRNRDLYLQKYNIQEI